MEVKQQEGEGHREKRQRLDSPSVKNLLRSFQAHKHTQVELALSVFVCLQLSSLSQFYFFCYRPKTVDILKDDPVHTALPELLDQSYKAIAPALFYLSTHMPELLSPTTCKSFPHCPTKGWNTKQKVITPPLGTIKTSLNAVPEILLQHNCLFSIPLSFKC